MRRERTASREVGGLQNEQHRASRSRAAGDRNQRKPETQGKATTGARNERGTKKKEEGAPSGVDENSATEGRGGGGGGAATTKGGQRRGGAHKTRVHREQRSRRPTKQTGQRARARSTRGPKPAKARDSGGAQKKRNGPPRGSDKNRETRKGGGVGLGWVGLSRLEKCDGPV